MISKDVFLESRSFVCSVFKSDNSWRTGSICSRSDFNDDVSSDWRDISFSVSALISERLALLNKRYKRLNEPKTNAVGSRKPVTGILFFIAVGFVAIKFVWYKLSLEGIWFNPNRFYPISHGSSVCFIGYRFPIKTPSTSFTDSRNVRRGI